MSSKETNFWDSRYSEEEFIYGTEPNEYIKEKLAGLQPAKILFVAEGEGRNAVYAATLGWEVTAFDQSQAGKEKALKLAEQKDVSIDYRIGNAENIEIESGTYDVLVFVYSHFPKEIRAKAHQHLLQALKPGGVLLMECFNKDHFANQQENPTAGGPRNIEMLYDLEEIQQEFSGVNWKEASNETVILSEGEHHKGKADVIRLMGRKLS